MKKEIGEKLVNPSLAGNLQIPLMYCDVIQECYNCLFGQLELANKSN